MGYHIIDMASDPRCGQFAYFRQMAYPFAGITAEIDITDFMACKGQRPFFLSFLYAVTRAANAVPQLRRRILEDGTVAEFDWCPPSYTAMKPDGVYVYCTVEGDLPYDAFIALGQRRQREVPHHPAGVAVRQPRAGRRPAYLPVLSESGDGAGSSGGKLARELIFAAFAAKRSGLPRQSADWLAMTTYKTQ